MKERIRNLLINGCKAVEVSTIVGCSPGYVSQLMNDEEFKKSVIDGKIAASAERTEEDHVDIRYQNLEHKILTSIEVNLDEASLGEKTRALETIIKRQDSRWARKNPANPPASPGVNINVVNLQLPAHAIQSHQPVLQMNEQSEIVAIDNQLLAPMSSDGVKGLFARILEAKRNQKAIQAEL